MRLKIQRGDGVESLTTLDKGEFKFAIEGCINFITSSPIKTNLKCLSSSNNSDQTHIQFEPDML